MTGRVSDQIPVIWWSAILAGRDHGDMGHESFLLRTYKSNGPLGWLSSLWNQGWDPRPSDLIASNIEAIDVVPHTASRTRMQSLHWRMDAVGRVGRRAGASRCMKSTYRKAAKSHDPQRMWSRESTERESYNSPPITARYLGRPVLQLAQRGIRKPHGLRASLRRIPRSTGP